MEASLHSLVVLVGAPLFVVFVAWAARTAWPHGRRWWLGRRRRRNSLEIITDYRLRAASKFGESLNTFVDVGTTQDETEVSAADISHRVTGGTVLAVIGPSGGGKSFLAQYLAVSHCDDGHLVAWLKASDYESGRFGDLFEGAMGPFSAEPWRTLIDAAAESGTPITVVIDGLNECPHPERADLLQQLTAFTLRHPANVLITSTTDDALGGALDAALLRIREPDEHARLKILSAHGAKHPGRVSEQFRTPYELAIAAECESDLDERASVTQLHDAYIRRFAPTEQLREGLRALASWLHSRFRTSLPLLDATSILNSPTLDLTPRQVDEVLKCPLLAIESHRVRFRHDLIGQFFAAEDVVRSSTTGQSLGRLLGLPAHRMLTETALGIEPDHNQVWEALKELASPELIFSALTTGYGPDVAEMAAQEIRDMMDRATASTGAAATITRTGGLFGRWVTGRRWTEWERALLAAAGRGLTRGLFVDQVCVLVDRTDDVCLAEAQRLRADGNRASVSLVVATTYALSADEPDGYGLAASYVVRAFEMARIMTRSTPDWRARGLAGRFVVDADARSWGRFYLALLSIDFRDVSDQALFASLLRRAWDAGGYHLQLKALSVAERFGGSHEPHGSEILDVIRELETDNWVLQGSLLEVLARFGEITNPTTAEELRDHIRTTILYPEDMDCCRMASGIVSSQFEDEALIGPYAAAIDGLTSQEKVRLFTMAVSGSDPTISASLDWTLSELTDLVPTGDAGLDAGAMSVFSAFLDRPAEDAIMPQEAVDAWLAAIGGWAKFESSLPPGAADLTSDQRNWRLVAELLLRYERDDAAVDQQEIWRTLLLDPQQAILTLASVRGATSSGPRGSVLGRFIEDYPEPLRRLFEWALENPPELSDDRFLLGTGTLDFVIGMLGAVGNESTAARLSALTDDPETGRAAVDAIRQIHRRVAP